MRSRIAHNFTPPKLWMCTSNAIAYLVSLFISASIAFNSCCTFSCDTPQIRTVLSTEPLARYRPSGDQLTELTAYLCPRSVTMHLKSRFASQMRTVSSADPLAKNRPSGDQLTDLTHLACPLSVAMHLKSCLSSQIRTVLSCDPLAKYRPSGDQLTEPTSSLCPRSVAIHLKPCFASQIPTSRWAIVVWMRSMRYGGAYAMLLDKSVFHTLQCFKNGCRYTSI